MFCRLYDDRNNLRLSAKEKGEELSNKGFFQHFESIKRIIKQYVTIINPLDLDRNFIDS